MSLISLRTSIPVIAAAALAAGSAAGPARAQPSPPSPAAAAALRPATRPARPIRPADKERARLLHAEGLRQYEAGQYGRAIAAYRKAYALVPAPGILFNLAQAYRLRGDCRRAHRAYRSFLRLAGDSPESKIAREHVQALRPCAEKAWRLEMAGAAAPAPAGSAPIATSASAAAASSAPGATAPGSAPASSEPQLSTGAPFDAPVPAGTPAVPAAAAPPSAQQPTLEIGRRDRDIVPDGQNKRLLGLGIGGAGAALMLVGVYYGFKARGEASDLDSFFGTGGTWTPELAARQDALESDRTFAVGFSLVGASAMAAGGVLYWLGHRDASAAEAAAHMQVSVAPQSDGAVIQWRSAF